METPSLNIPDNISVIDITIGCSNYSGGEVKVSGMKLAKSLGITKYLNVSPDELLQLGYGFMVAQHLPYHQIQIGQ